MVMVKEQSAMEKEEDNGGDGGNEEARGRAIEWMSNERCRVSLLKFAESIL